MEMWSYVSDSMNKGRLSLDTYKSHLRSSFKGFPRINEDWLDYYVWYKESDY